MSRKVITLIAGLMLASSFAQATYAGSGGNWGDGTPNNTNVVVELPAWYAMFLDWF